MALRQPQSQSISTPPSPTRGRMQPRYPTSLSREQGRVPLHKRGKSRTYEAMEDLLREAGYKETRIFTPETERTESRAAEWSGRTASRVEQVVDFLAGWMPGMNRSEEHLATEDSRPSVTQSTPPSPLSGKRPKPLPSTGAPSPADLTSIMAAPGSPKRGVGRGRQSLPTERTVRPHSSASDSLRAYATTQGYLRHMSSTPNIPKASRTASIRQAPRVRTPKGVTRGPEDGHADTDHPPMPSGWLDSVTKAILGSSTTGAHAGKPRPGIRQPHRTHSHLALTDHTNKVRPMMGSLRADTAPGAVNTAIVVCRSAPSSRSSSRVGERLSYVSDKMAKQRGVRARALRRARGDDSDAVPSLASTQLENDEWGLQWVDGKRVPTVVADDIDCSDDNDEEDDGEIDLARILVNPKRQKSIRSLRQHLHRCDSARALRTPALRPLEPYILDDDEDCADKKNDFSRERRLSRRGSMDEGSGWEGLGIPGLEPLEARRRRGLPVTWSNLGSGR